jgi:adenylate kinase
MRVLLLGPPGAGKGTQAVRIAERYGIANIASGALLRSHVAEGTDLGRAVKGYMDRGDLVPDGLIITLVYDEVVAPAARDGFVLDGFPRTLGQAEIAYDWARMHDMTFHAAVHLELSDTELLRRLRARASAEGRSDDAERTARHRLEVFAARTHPLVEFYTGRGILEPVDALGGVDEVTARIFAALDMRQPA